MRTRGVMRLAAALAVLALVAGCQQNVRPSPTPSASATSGRPRFELATYEYALQTKGRIKVAIRPGTPPLSSGPTSGTATGTVQGFEPDLAREIARAIFGAADDPDSHIEWVSVDDATRLGALTSGRADIAVAAIAITEDTKRMIDLSDPYLTVGQRLLVKKANDQIKEIADVATGEETVCAVKDSKAENELRKVTNDRAKILELSTFDFCLQALSSGAADAIASDEIDLLGLVAKRPDDFKLVGKAFGTVGLGIGMKKNVAGDRQGFRDFIDATVRELVASRTWAKLYQRDVAPVSGDSKQLPTD